MRYRKLLAAASAAVVTVILGLVANVSAADKYEVIYNFGGSGLISDAVGNLYGAAAYGNGVVYKLSHDTDGRWRETVLHSFQSADGTNPLAGLIFDRAGNLYGTAPGGGVHGKGVVFKLTPDADGVWTETVLHSFQGADGASPGAGLIFDRAGNLYGTTSMGGSLNNGTVFMLTPDADGKWIETVLHSFQVTDGVNPVAGLIFDPAGNLYGTTGGFGDLSFGNVFKLTPNADGIWTETVLHSFDNTDGNSPQAPVVFDRAGNLYGTTSSGGSYGDGIVFKLAPDVDGAWTETVLHSFLGGDGAGPIGDLVIDSAGNVYGTTAGGGTGACFPGGCGTVFRITL
jgi:uncharacterized repeat protein (TIGR03803 family)